jgi:hypothetical protein
MTVNDIVQRRPLPVYYDTPPEQREAIRLWAQSYAARLDGILGRYLVAPATVTKR